MEDYQVVFCGANEYFQFARFPAEGKQQSCHLVTVTPIDERYLQRHVCLLDILINLSDQGVMAVHHHGYRHNLFYFQVTILN